GRERALDSEQEAQRKLSLERATWLRRIEESRRTGDRLFSWVMEAGHLGLPPLEGRDHRLTRLERYFEGFLERTNEVVELAEERARARLQLAEISMAQGDPELAAKRFEEAVEELGKMEASAQLSLRLAVVRLVLARLYQQQDAAATGQAFQVARLAAERLPQAELEGDRFAYLMASLDLYESRFVARNGEEGRALQLMRRATQRLNALAEDRPEATVVRSELARSYLSTAGLLVGSGDSEEVRSLRSLAAKELLKLIEADPTDLELRLELAGCYAAMAESAWVAGDVARAESMSKGAATLLEDLLPQLPKNVVLRSRLAAQRGLMGGIMRDRGEGERALALYDEGLGLLEDYVEGEERDARACHRFALLTWEKGRMLGFSGDRGAEIRHEEKAVEMLRGVMETPFGQAQSEWVRRSLAYLLGDLGHAAQLGGQEDLAVASFSRAVGYWEELHEERPDREEYAGALTWSRQRLEEVGRP
ncbi:MAG: tetratricopeptide repeat protein, partial [Verrucomicrobiales bacterium]